MARRPLVLGAIALVIAGAGVWLIRQPGRPATGQTRVRLKGTEFSVGLASTPLEHEKGLSGTDHIAADGGMLFVFDPPEESCFWMKGVPYNLDILWFDSQNRLMHQAENIAPSSYPMRFCSSTPARYVLEIAGGQARRRQVVQGDRLEILDLDGLR